MLTATTVPSPPWPRSPRLPRVLAWPRPSVLPPLLRYWSVFFHVLGISVNYAYFPEISLHNQSVCLIHFLLLYNLSFCSAVVWPTLLPLPRPPSSNRSIEPPRSSPSNRTTNRTTAAETATPTRTRTTPERTTAAPTLLPRRFLVWRFLSGQMNWKRPPRRMCRHRYAAKVDYRFTILI